MRCPATSISNNGYIIPCLVNHDVDAWDYGHEHGGWVVMDEIGGIWWINYDDDNRLPLNWIGASWFDA